MIHCCPKDFCRKGGPLRNQEMWITAHLFLHKLLHLWFQQKSNCHATSCISGCHCGEAGEGCQLFEVSDKENVNQKLCNKDKWPLQMSNTRLAINIRDWITLDASLLFIQKKDFGTREMSHFNLSCCHGFYCRRDLSAPTEAAVCITHSRSSLGKSGGSPSRTLLRQEMPFLQGWKESSLFHVWATEFDNFFPFNLIPLRNVGRWG